MIVPVVVVLDECVDLLSEIAGQIIVFQQDAVLERLVPALDLALGLGMIWRTANMIHLLVFEPISQFTRDVTGAVVAEQTWLVNDRRLITARKSLSRLSSSRTLGSYPWRSAWSRNSVIAAFFASDRSGSKLPLRPHPVYRSRA